MIVVDTSALMAILLGEPARVRCFDVLEGEAEVLISAGTVMEARVVAGKRGVGGKLEQMFDRLTFDIVPLTATRAHRAADAYKVWGKGNHEARLNICDCFAYALAKERDVPLLFVGEDFAKTDVRVA